MWAFKSAAATLAIVVISLLAPPLFCMICQLPSTPASYQNATPDRLASGSADEAGAEVEEVKPQKHLTVVVAVTNPSLACMIGLRLLSVISVALNLQPHNELFVVLVVYRNLVAPDALTIPDVPPEPTAILVPVPCIIPLHAVVAAAVP